MSNRKTKKDEKRTWVMITVLVGMIILTAVPYLLLGNVPKADIGESNHSADGNDVTVSTEEEWTGGERSTEFNKPGTFTSDEEDISGTETTDKNGDQDYSGGNPDYSGTVVNVTDVNGGKLWAGETLRYDIVVLNSGEVPGTDLVLSCPLPNETGYIIDSASGFNPAINENNTLIEWEIDYLGKDEMIDFSFEVFVADYVTFEDDISSAFLLKDGYRTFELDNPSIKANAFAFNTIVCMGDSQIVLTQWPEILDKDIEELYPHSDFNIISSAAKGESATDAIRRFDRDVRAHNPDIIVLGYGTNDAGESPAVFKYHMDILIRQALSTGAEVFVHGIGYVDTSNAKWKDKSNYVDFDEILKSELCPKYGVVYIDIYSEMSPNHEKYFQEDGIHWNKEGAAFVSSQVLKAIVVHLDKDGNLIKS
jgi:uncharacterized repeat protein (TIGR01451 family)